MNSESVWSCMTYVLVSCSSSSIDRDAFWPTSTNWALPTHSLAPPVPTVIFSKIWISSRRIHLYLLSVMQSVLAMPFPTVNPKKLTTSMEQAAETQLIACIADMSPGATPGPAVGHLCCLLQSPTTNQCIKSRLPVLKPPVQYNQFCWHMRAVGE